MLHTCTFFTPSVYEEKKMSQTGKQTNKYENDIMKFVREKFTWSMKSKECQNCKGSNSTHSNKSLQMENMKRIRNEIIVAV